MSNAVRVASRVHLLVEGPSEGEPVVLLHAGASSSNQWGALVARLRARYRVFAPDLLGEGRTPAPPDWSRLVAGDVELALSVIDAAGGSAHLVGHSYGGVVALAAARARPGAVRSLALLEPVAFQLLGGAPDALLRPLFAAREACAAASARGDAAVAAAVFVDYWSGAGSFARLPPPARAAVAAAVGKCAHGWRAIFDEPDTLADYEALGIPALVVAGKESPAPSRWIAERLAATLPAADLAEVAGAGHMAPLTHASTVNELVERHLGRHGRARRPRSVRSVLAAAAVDTGD